MHGKTMKNLVSGYPKTVVSHCRGCIFQGFQCLQKSGNTTSEIDSKWPPNPLKSGSEGSPKRSLKLQWKIKKTWWKKVFKMRCKKRVVLVKFGVFLRSGSKGVPGWFQGPSQELSKVDFGCIFGSFAGGLWRIFEVFWELSGSSFRGCFVFFPM